MNTQTQNPCLDMPQACLHPSKADIAEILDTVKKDGDTNEILIGKVMKHYKGACNPAVIKEIITKIY